MKILVVGAGLSGATVARSCAERGHKVLVIEKRNHIAGNCYDYKNEHGILMNKYGAHIFHTNSERVWKYVNRFAEWVPWNHKVIGKIGDKTFPIPVNIETVNTVCGTNLQTEEDMRIWLEQNTIPCDNPANSEEVGLSRVGKELYEAIFKQYTYKQWNKYPEELEPSVLERIPVRCSWDVSYFSDRFQALPKHGYTEMISKMLDHPNIIVFCKVEYRDYFQREYDKVIFTGPIDQYFAEAGYPKLEYRSIHFAEETLNIDQFQENSVVNYPSANEPFTRIVEYKHFLHQEVKGKTTIVREYTTDVGEPYYPVPTKANQELYQKYQQLAEKEPKVFFVGRLAKYKYYNMDAAIEAALEFTDKLLNL